jgi:hypothetical protein
MKICIDCKVAYPLSYFYKNKKMPDGHLNSCKACRRKWDNEYKSTNKEKLYKETKDWKEDNKEKVSEYRKEYWILNSDKEKELAKKWRKVNRGICNSYGANYRSSKKNATPWWSDLDVIKEIYKSARELTILTGIQFHVDHILPLNNPTVQGLHIPANLRIIPYYENLSKSNRIIEDIVCS